MAYDNGIFCQTFEAGQDLSAKQYFFVTRAADGQIDPTGAAAAADGVLQNDPDAAGKQATVATSPGTISKVVIGAAVTNNDLLEADSSGRGVTVSSGKVLAKALAAGTAAGQIIPALLILQR